MKPAGDMYSPRGRGRGPWRQGQDYNELRRPHGTGNVPGLASPDPEARGDVAKKTALSPDAKEFFPKGYQPQQFEEAPGPGGDAGSIHYNSMASSQEPFTLEHLREVMQSLTLNPGRFDAVIESVTSTFSHCQGDMIQEVVDSIVTQSVLEPNFRYNGARLCVFLRNASTPDMQNIFRNCILHRCQEENSHIPMFITSHPQRVHGFALFLAELYTQMDVAQGTDTRITILGAGLFEVLSILLSSPTAESVKCVCQALKLAGLGLDNQDPLRMSSLFDKLILAPALCPEISVRHMVTSVVQLRQCTWGNTSTPSQSSSSLQQNCTNEPVFYGPDGQILTAEESRFLQDNVGQVQEDYDEYGEDGENWMLDDEEDEEFDAAYEEFLHISNQIKKT